MCTTSNKKYFHKMFFILLITLQLLACSNQKDDFYDTISLSSNHTEAACIDVSGRVRGNIIPNSSVFLYKTSATMHMTVMAEIRTNSPVDRQTVNETNGFTFTCLTFGNYAIVALTDSYNTTIGYPLPYERDCNNLSIRIAFQGGDSKYAVGSFTIIKEENSGYQSHPYGP